MADTCLQYSLLDLSGPAHSTIARQSDVLPWVVMGVAVAGNYACVAGGGSGLVILRFALYHISLL